MNQSTSKEEDTNTNFYIYEKIS